MKKIPLLFITFLLFSSVKSLAEEAKETTASSTIEKGKEEKAKKNEIFVELGGAAPLFSLNYQRSLVEEKLFLRLGVGYYPSVTLILGFWPEAGVSMTSNIMLSYHVVHSGPSAFEIALGPQFIYGTSVIAGFSPREEYGFGGVLSAGYHYQKDAISLRIGLTAMGNTLWEFTAMPYLGIGLCF